MIRPVSAPCLYTLSATINPLFLINLKQPVSQYSSTHPPKANHTSSQSPISPSPDTPKTQITPNTGPKNLPIPQIPPNHSSDNASPDTRPLPTPNSHPRANHSPSPKSPQITVQTMPVQTPAPSPPQTPIPAQITAHPPNPPKSQFRQCQSRHPPPPHPKLPSTRKSQPILQIPPNHSSDNLPVQTTSS